MNIQNLPLSKLVPSPANVRKTDRSNGIEQLAASIKAHGLLQNVQVKEAANGQFEVIAGGRRLAALRLLAKRKEIEADHPVPCNVLDGEDMTEISLAENEIRQAMHPADQFDAFKALADGDMSEDDIAARFGVPPLAVRQRLKLANVSAKIIAAYRKGELDLECIMAFAVTDDHKAQERVWKAWRSYPEYQREAENIRAMLTEQHIDADSKLALFVTVKAYEKAGGSVIRDLFDADSEGWLTDAELLNRLATEKLAAVQAKLIEDGWKWADIMPDIDYSALHRFERLRASRNDDDDKDSFTDKQKAKSGCIIAIGLRRQAGSACRVAAARRCEGRTQSRCGQEQGQGWRAEGQRPERSQRQPHRKPDSPPDGGARRQAGAQSEGGLGRRGACAGDRCAVRPVPLHPGAEDQRHRDLFRGRCQRNR